MKVALYARVSKIEDQNPENQLIQLREWATKANAQVVGEYVEAISSRDTRPIKEELKRKARLGEIDAIAIVSLDRWGRSMSELVLDIEEFTERNIQLISLKEGLRFDTAVGKLYAHLLAAFADFERERIRERTIAGLVRVRAQGKKLGRPRKTPPVNPDAETEESINQLKNVRFINTQDASRSYPKEWIYIREKALAISRHICNKCKMQYEQSALELDHIIPIAVYQFAFHESNLQILCKACHEIKNKEDYAKYEFGKRD